MTESVQAAAPEKDDDPGAVVNPVPDIAAGLVLAAVSLFALFWLIPQHTGSAAGEFDVSPGFFPRIAAIVTLILSLMLVGHRLLRFARLQRRPGGGAVLVEIAVWTVACVAITAGLSFIGYLFVAPVVIGVAMLAAGERRWWLILLIAAATTAITYVGADLIFDVALP